MNQEGRYFPEAQPLSVSSGITRLQPLGCAKEHLRKGRRNSEQLWGKASRVTWSQLNPKTYGEDALLIIQKTKQGMALRRPENSGLWDIAENWSDGAFLLRQLSICSLSSPKLPISSPALKYWSWAGQASPSPAGRTQVRSTEVKERLCKGKDTSLPAAGPGTFPSQEGRTENYHREARPTQQPATSCIHSGCEGSGARVQLPSPTPSSTCRLFLPSPWGFCTPALANSTS